LPDHLDPATFKKTSANWRLLASPARLK